MFNCTYAKCVYQGIDQQNEYEVVISRLKEIYGTPSDNALCIQIGVSPQTLSSWKSRNKVTYAKCVETSKEKGISLDWLLTGTGSMLRGSVDSQESTVSRSDLTLLELLNQLDPDVRRDLLRGAEEKQRLIDMEKKLQELSDELERVKKTG
ncbi:MULTISPECIES: helix-turn-helix domain-containing protein [Pectobacterium]|uniref:helix-turn-helix domain-containing protein n=1 Tax=Pectobacterium TaxID=122277 RepID=UPI00200F0096|nr:MULTISPECIES: helix-turn-helix domain-containing protein [Pectobacterium]UPY96717.1 helix-turn-helix domain containing protein [Pectobacterium sp. 21LCBS03]WJM79724.1 helix-turn-helix domain-containing protein [Pectobacterium brasiliense]